MVGNGAGVLPFGNYGSADGAGSREDGEVQYIVVTMEQPLTIQGDGEITSQALNANVTAEQKKKHSLLWRLAPALQGLQMVTARYFPRV